MVHQLQTSQRLVHMRAALTVTLKSQMCVMEMLLHKNTFLQEVVATMADEKASHHVVLVSIAFRIRPSVDI